MSMEWKASTHSGEAYGWNGKHGWIYKTFDRAIEKKPVDSDKLYRITLENGKIVKAEEILVYLPGR